MALVSVEERFLHGRPYSNDLGVKTATREWLIKTDDKTEDGPIVESYVPVALGEQHPTSPQMTARSLQLKHVAGSATDWLASAQYSSSRDVPGESEDPFAEVARVHWSTEQFQRPADQDKDGFAVVNSAGDLFDPPAMRDDSRLVARVSKNVPQVPAWILTYFDSVNSAAFTLGGLTIPPRTAKIQAVEIGERQVRGDFEYYTITTSIHFRADEWKLKLLDAGFRELDPDDSTKRIEIVADGDSTTPTTAALLDGSGAALVDPKPEDAVFLEFDVYEEKDFGVLPLF